DPPPGDRADPCLDDPLRAIAVPYDTVAPIRQPGIPHRGKKRFRLRFHRLGEETPGAVPQHRRQWIIDSIGLTKGNNSAIARHGVSAPSGVQAGFHPPRYAASFTSPSPNLPHSSDCWPAYIDWQTYARN